MKFASPNQLAEAYVDLWNERDAKVMAEKVKALYSDDAFYVFYRRDPFVGHEALTEQVLYTQGIYFPLGYRFVSAYNAVGHHNLVRFNWNMVHTETGDIQMAGQDTLILDEDGRIKADYQFHEKIPTAFVYNDGFDETGRVTKAAKPTLVTQQG
ncbi:nuclear transport factor 2 family protein [Kitasatospora griseola]|uniref:nuclear transport factor 2 family protein n=1 Tax=Kitasatospora griseola TaxID=2064 RepID=UPI0016715E19|nr:nuclear transport factor 2 family protein [Kitasatospora griseola]